MANISIGHQELQQAAADVRARMGELQQFLDQASRAVEQVTGRAYRTRTASGEFQNAHAEWNQATSELINRLEEVARAIEETRQRDEQADQEAAGRVGNIRGNGGGGGGGGGPAAHPHAEGVVPDGSEIERRLGYYDDFRWKPGSQPDEDLPPELSWLGPRDSSDRPPLAPDPHPDAEGRVPGPNEVADRLNPSDGAPANPDPHPDAEGRVPGPDEVADRLNPSDGAPGGRE
jgi:uncharacterized protein YukE